MKNYYDQQQELQVALYRLESLQNKKQLYFNMTQPGTTDYSKEFVDGGVHKDILLEYVSKIEKIDKEIEVVEKEIEMLDKYLKKMEKGLRSMKNPLDKIFVAKYIDGLSVLDICEKGFSQADVYRKLQLIKKIIQEGE